MPPKKSNLLLLSCGTYDNTIRWIPPLNVTVEQINDGLKIFGEALKETSSNKSVQWHSVCNGCKAM